MLLWLLTPALADPPTDAAMAAICAGRSPCQRVSHHYAGPDALGHDLQVVELLLAEADPEAARWPSYGEPCSPFEWHVVRYGPAEEVIGHRKVLELCNDGYGASGVGEDRVEVKPNRLVHDQMGGSSWRWSQGQTVQLWPERVVEEWAGSWRSPMGHTAERRWSWETLTGWVSEEKVWCGDSDEPRLTEVRGVQLPQVPPQEGPGPCGAEVHAGDDRGLVVFGEPSTPTDGRMVVALHDERTVVVDVFDDHWHPTAERWIHADHLELWLNHDRDPNDIHCLEGRWPAHQWGVMVDGTVHPGHGSPAADALGAVVTPIDGGHRFTLTLPVEPRALSVVFSDSDDGLTQERLLATSTLTAGDAHTFGTPRAFDARCTPAGQRADRWDPRWEPLLGDVAAPLRESLVAFEAIATVDDFTAAWTRSYDLVPRANARSETWFAAHDAEPLDLGWAERQAPGWTGRLYGEGSTLLWSLEVAPWQAAAKRTPGDDDDRFVELLALAWGNLSFTALPAWLTLTWDGGGCNDLGDGEHLAVLKATDAPWPEPLRPAVAKVRAAALDSLTRPTQQFPFCNGDGPDDRTRALLEGEVDRILSEVALTGPERSALVERRAHGFQPGAWPADAP